MIPRAAFSLDHVAGNIVFIVDNDGPVSVTNDAEAVCRFLDDHYPSHRIVYRDTQGDWDELLHNNGVFTGFGPYRENSERGN